MDKKKDKKVITQIIFSQLAERNKKILARQKPVTLQQAKAQVKRLKQNRKA